MKHIQFNIGLKTLFEARKIFLAGPGIERIPANTMLGFDTSCRLEAYSQILSGLRLPLEFGAFSYTQSQVDPHVRVGRYCSIAPGVRWGGPPHPLDWVTTFPLTYDTRPLPAVADFFQAHQIDVEREPFDDRLQPITIGHDVWIGREAYISNGVTVGAGAVIAAGAIVTKDVAPYAIVGGNPARLIRPRFAEDVVARMLKSEWWIYSPKDFAHLKMVDPVSFLDRFEAIMERGPLDPITYEVVTGSEMIRVVQAVGA